MRKYLAAGPWLAVALACLTLPDSAGADLRWRADGHVCRPWNQDTLAEPGARKGLLIKENLDHNTMDTVSCSIPTGVYLVDLGETNHMLGQVNVRLGQEELQATITTQVHAHDFDSASYCNCGHTIGLMLPGAYSLRTMPFDCGGCLYDEAWAVSLGVIRSGKGTTAVKLIIVYDEN